jgi:MvaI/BcnI restriction endonuclease family
VKIFTKESLTADLLAICKGSWIQSHKKPGNDGAIGNALERLLEIEENNLPLPNAAEWELKGQRRQSKSLVTLFHMDPSPQAMGLVNNLLVAKYGWPLDKHPNELSFRQTITSVAPSDRGFQVVLNEEEQKVEISFDSNVVADKHNEWLQSVEKRIELGQLNPQPYWGFIDLEYKAGTKLKNTFFVLADTKIQDNIEYFKYNGILMLKTFSFEKFLEALKHGILKIDFDARNGYKRRGHNHGTKFRIATNLLPTLYEEVTIIFDEPLQSKERVKIIDISTAQSIKSYRTARDIEKAASEGPTIVQMPLSTDN